MKHLLPCRVYRQDRDRQTGATPRRRWMEDDRWWWPRDRRQQQSHACTASNGIKGRGAAESKRKEHGPGPGQGRPAPAGQCMHDSLPIRLVATMPATTPYPLLCPSVLGSGADRPPATVSGGMQPASHGGRARPDDIHGAQAQSAQSYY